MFPERPLGATVHVGGIQRRGLVTENAHEIIPRAEIIVKQLDQLKVIEARERLERIRVEAITIDGIPVNRSCGGDDHDHKAVGREHARHLSEHQPERGAVFEHLTGDQNVDRAVRKGDVVRCGHHNLYAPRARNVDRLVFELRVIKELSIAPVVIATADVRDADNVMCIKKLAPHMLLEAATHVLIRRRMHYGAVT